MHVTLAFVGAVPDGHLEKVVAAVRDAARIAPFAVALDAVGRFPASGAPQVAWLGIGQGAAEMTALAEAMRRGLAARALPFDAKPFRPHLTLARVRENADRDSVRAIAATLASARVRPLRFNADTVAVVESVLSPRGPRYTSLATVPLTAGGTA